MMIVDASVMVKWFLKEELSETAIVFSEQDHDLYAPFLAQYEVASSFSRALRKKEIDVEGAEVCLHRWLHILKTHVVKLLHDRQDIERGHHLAVKLHHATADCIYLAMAERLGGTLVTADKVFIEKCTPDYQVMHLNGYR